VSWVTYFQGYAYPPSPFWDESYHITSAEKYLNKVMFMEAHPPLGKLFIALGEKIINPNKAIDTSTLTETDHANKLPKGYSFAGVRLFPALFGWLSAVLFFLVLYMFSKNAHLAALFSSLYIFDNAIIVHSRGAMLESTQIFFILIAILYFAYLVTDAKRIFIRHYAILGALIGLSVMVKITGLILVPLLGFLFIYEHRDKWSQVRTHAWRLVNDLVPKILVTLAMMVAVFCIIWYIHISLGTKISGDKYYKASDAYKQMITAGTVANLSNFPRLVEENLGYMSQYIAGVPKLDVCKPQGENGSSPSNWPLGGKAINYRWDRAADGVAQYLYLQSNPATWFVGFAAIVISITLVIAKVLFGLEIRNKRLFWLILSFVVLYGGYMAMMFRIERVMYLYHYFIPLIFTYILAYLIFNYMFSTERIQKNKPTIYAAVLGCMFVVILIYSFFSPLTYYGSLTKDQFNERTWLEVWQLKAV